MDTELQITHEGYDDGADIDSRYIENPLKVSVYDTMADYSKLHDATGWDPTIDFEEGVKRVCESYKAP